MQRSSFRRKQLVVKRLTDQRVPEPVRRALAIDFLDQLQIQRGLERRQHICHSQLHDLREKFRHEAPSDRRGVHQHCMIAFGDGC